MMLTQVLPLKSALLFPDRESDVASHVEKISTAHIMLQFAKGL